MKLKYIHKEKFPPFISNIYKISPEALPITAYSRILCQNCGLWNRGLLCNPLLSLTYPQYKTTNSTKEFFNSFDEAYIYVFKNDGSKRFWYKSENEKYSHLRMRTVTSGRQLKGIEAVGSRYLTRLMYKIRKINRKSGFTVETYISGHCDLCAHKCPNRNNPPCRRGGLPSMEATGINVYSLLANLGIEYEFPVMTYLTQVTMMCVKK